MAEEETGYTVEELANAANDACGNPHWKGYLPVRVQTTGPASAAVINVEIGNDPKHGPCMLLTPDHPTDDFLNRVHCLIFSMRERGVTGDDPWWGQDFLGVQQLLEAKGLNCNPEKAS